jgi:hypothetical protein
MRFRPLCLLFALTLTAALASSSAQAEEVANSAGVFDIYAAIGLGGEIVVEDSEDDLDNAFGLGFIYTKRVQENFSLGGSLSAISWLADGNGNEDRDRNTLINLGLRPEGHLEVSPIIDLVFAANLGLTYSIIGENDFGLGEVDPALGFFLGIAFGTRIEIREGQGLQIEIALQRHQAEHEVDTLIGNFDVDSELALGTLNLGYYFQ